MNDTPRPLGLAPSFGFGDRMGSATPGHIAACRGTGIAPIYSQQSIREMTRTQRTPEQVMTAAREAIAAEGWGETWGADADHLKTPADVDYTLAAGFCFFTIDPSDHVDGQADDYDEATLEAKYEAVKSESEWMQDFAGEHITLSTGTSFSISDHDLKRAAVKYGKAVNEAMKLADYIKQASENVGQDYEIEISVDETPQPTTLAEHYIIAKRFLSGGTKLVSLAPRFIGELEKGVDYIGDVAALEASIADHNAIAEMVGPYKLSLHSGSDKLSMYTPFARATKGRFHVKTAGTSYLEALRVAAQSQPDFFREIVEFSRGRYETDKATYHVHATLEMVPGTDQVSDAKELERLYLELWDEVPEGKGFTNPGRQILHCTFGSVLTDSKLGPALHQCIADNTGLFQDILELHFTKHLDALQKGMG